MNTNPPSWPHWIARSASVLALLTGIVVPLGWALDVAVLKGIVPGFMPMVPNTAIAFGLAGLSLWLFSAEPSGRLRKRAAQIAAFLVMLIGAISLGEYLTGWRPGIDQLFFREKIAALGTPVAGRPAFLAAFSFLCLGTALLLFEARRSRTWVVELLIVIPVQISLLALIGYACNVPSFYRWTSIFSSTGMALNTTIVFAVLGIGILCSRPNRGLMKIITSATAGGVVARRLLLAPVIIPLVTGLIGPAGRKAGFYNAEFAGWFFSFLNIFIFTAMIWWLATLLHEAEMVRLNAEQEVRQLNDDLERRVAERTVELKEAKKSLQEREARLQLIIDTALDAVITIDQAGLVTGWSRQAEVIFGWPAMEALGRRLSEIIIPSRHRAAHEQGLKHFAATGHGPVLNRRIEITALRRDGQEIPIELAIAPMQIGGAQMFSAFVRDISERKQADERAAWLASFPEANPNPVLELDWATGAVNYANPCAVRLFPDLQRRGFEHPWLAGLREAAGPLLDGQTEALRREIMAGHACYAQTINYIAKTQRLRVYGTDTTQRKAAEEALARERNFLRLLISNLPACVYVKDLEGRFLIFNEASVRMIGLSSESEALGKTVFDFFPPEIARLYEADDRCVLAGETVLDREEPTQDHQGVRRWFLTTKLPLRDAQGAIIGLVGISQDITARKQGEVKLQAQLARLALLNQITRAIGERQNLESIFQVAIKNLEENLPIDFGCICLYDAVAEVLIVANVGTKIPGLQEKLDLTKATRIAIDPNGLTRCVHGELVYEPNVGQVPFPFPARLASGGLHSLIAAPLLVESKVFGVLVAARRDANAFSSPDCEFVRQLSEHVALAAHQAQIHSALQEAYTELRQTQQSTLQQERLRALGQMASGIAHDINNAISPITLYTESLLEREANLSQRAREQLTTIQNAIEDVAQTVARMREFYRQREPQLTLVPIDFNRLFQQVLDLTRVRWRDMPQERGVVIRLETDFAPDLPAVMGADGEIRDALTNLIINAMDAMPEGGVLTLRTRAAIQGPESSPGDPATRVIAEVRDTGVGMDEETRRRCLEPFYSTKGERGTGLGLAMVYGMVERHSAEIEIESQAGQGTTVRLIFPVTRVAGIPSAGAITPPRPAQRLRILVVDDDPLLMKSLQDTLEDDGHLVTTADGGQAGIDAFQAAQPADKPFAVVITDLGMPYVDGRKVASAVKAASPSTPVIMLTGWGQRLMAEGDIPPHVDQVLNKPPKLRELREALARHCPSAST